MNTLVDKLIESETVKLRDEITELKQCQLDYLKYAATLFAFVISSVTALLQFGNINFDSNININIATFLYHYSLLFLFLIIIFIIPHFSWIIIHKCRSIFRIVGYLKLLEEIIVHQKVKTQYLGYETLHSYIKHYHPWLTKRFDTSFSKVHKRIIDNFKTYSSIAEKAHYNKEFAFKLESELGLEKENKHYIGDYYGRMTWFLWMIFFSFTVAFITYSVYLIFFKFDDSFENKLFIINVTILIIINVAIILWFVYKSILYHRYLKELRFRPFSIDAWYDMFKWATIELENKKKSKPTPKCGILLKLIHQLKRAKK